jgi:hypothetical protein
MKTAIRIFRYKNAESEFLVFCRFPNLQKECKEKLDVCLKLSVVFC